MQPYVFPYLGYFQLIHGADRFVLYDDVAYIKGGRINRNAILSGTKKQRFTIPVSGASSNKEIRDVLVFQELRWKRKILATFEQAYSAAPFLKVVFPLFEDVLKDTEDLSIARLAARSIQSVVHFLGIESEIGESSCVYENKELGPIERLVDICRQEGAVTLINPAGGKDLYSKDIFRQQGIDLRFLHMRNITYRQFWPHTFVPRLSIIDVLMFNGREGTRTLLEEYDLR